MECAVCGNPGWCTDSLDRVMCEECANISPERYEKMINFFYSEWVRKFTIPIKMGVWNNGTQNTYTTFPWTGTTTISGPVWISPTTNTISPITNTWKINGSGGSFSTIQSINPTSN